MERGFHRKRGKTAFDVPEGGRRRKLEEGENHRLCSRGKENGEFVSEEGEGEEKKERKGPPHFAKKKNLRQGEEIKGEEIHLQLFGRERGEALPFQEKREKRTTRDFYIF